MATSLTGYMGSNMAQQGAGNMTPRSTWRDMFSDMGSGLQGFQNMQALQGQQMAGNTPAREQNYTPMQMERYNQMAQYSDPNSYTARLAGGDQSAFAEMEAPAMRQFDQLQGQNASRFSGMGMGARHGSGFNNSMNQATSDFAQDLQSKRMGLQQQAIKDMMSMSNELLGYEFEPKKKKKWWEQLLGGALPLAGGLGGAMVGGPGGAQAGYMMGNAAAQTFQ